MKFRYNSSFMLSCGLLKSKGLKTGQKSVKAMLSCLLALTFIPLKIVKLTSGHFWAARTDSIVFFDWLLCKHTRSPLPVSRLSGVIPSRDTAMKPCVKTLEVQRLREKSAPMPIIFGLLFEVHSGPADGVSSSQQGGGGWDGRLLPLGAACFQTVDFMLHLCPLHPLGFFFLSERD